MMHHRCWLESWKAQEKPEYTCTAVHVSLGAVSWLLSVPSALLHVEREVSNDSIVSDALTLLLKSCSTAAWTV